MQRILSSSLFLSILALAATASAQPQPLPPLPPPATDAAPSSLNPQPEPPPASPGVTPQPLPPLPSQAPVYAPSDPSAGPPPVSPPPYPYPYPPAPAYPPPPPPGYVPEGYRLVRIDGSARMHDGFYFRAALGGGALALLGSGPNGSVHAQGPAATFTAAVGGTVIPGLAVGGALSFSGTTSQGESGFGAPIDAATFLQLGPFVDWFPDPHGGWHVGGSVGVATASVSIGSNDGSNDSHNSGSSTAFGGEVFGGRDFWISDQWSFGLQAHFAFATSASLQGNDVGYGGYFLGGVGGGLEVSFLYH